MDESENTAKYVFFLNNCMNLLQSSSSSEGDNFIDRAKILFSSDFESQSDFSDNNSSFSDTTINSESDNYDADDEFDSFTVEEENSVRTYNVLRNFFILDQVYDFLLNSSSEEEEDLFNCMQQQLVVKNGKIPRITNYIQIVHEYSNEEFRRTFRLSRNAAYKVVEMYSLSNFCCKRSDGKTPEEDVLAFLYFAATKIPLRCVGTVFNSSESTVLCQCERVMDFLMYIAPEIIKIPDDLPLLAHEFRQISGVPNVIGCIDGSYINMKTPAHKAKASYLNRHDAVSLTLQGVCDHRRRFIDVFTGVSGKLHDARTFRLSPFSSFLPHLSNGRYHIIGDNAYPIREYLIVPYRNYGDMTGNRKRFNKKLSQTRVLIENAFGILKGRFHQLLEIDMHTIEKITKFIVSCCVLHNLCIDNGDEWSEEVVENINGSNEELPEENENGDALKKLGEDKRDRMLQYLTQS